jgi:hypothetical protein
MAAALPTATVPLANPAQPTAAPAASGPATPAPVAATPAPGSGASDPVESSTHTAVSPEQAMQLVQKAGLDSSQVLSVDLVTDATGHQFFEIRSNKSTDAPIRVDAQTGAVITPSPAGK